jgi:hypothetical protein
LADSSPLTFRVTPFPVQLPPKGPGSARLTDVVGCGAAVLGGCVGGAGVLVAPGVLVEETAGVRLVLVVLPPHAETRTAVAGKARSAQRRHVLAMVLILSAQVGGCVVGDVDLVGLGVVVTRMLGDRGADWDQLRGRGRHRRRLADDGDLDDAGILHL